ncbi:hypothetical protein P153DRAFT_390653 [Dothidotthia symphoricarpi CBS 119687]|uniref:Uncharacterized protein n=1 Tax=Dothidotthia symphoricarpi CBS 119687 TaxID=1392245 RepID=A0A6A5ZWH8_9PLEO|nr:uncharacterized protein P153DRAFT_390653 [Dothidotthia symphoricarpi CBS 119687]KAF2124102.1 hypothetical protein P153DRAFT_390653 [Dothidotthia symphoricarpi CBS 119687]
MHDASTHLSSSGPRAGILVKHFGTQDFYAISLYHAGLTLWAYGLLNKGLHRKQMLTSHPGRNHRASIAEGHGVFFLDGIESAETQKFVALNRAIPVISKRQMPPTNEGVVEMVPLDDPKAVMETVISVLQLNHRVHAIPPLAENLTHLMHDLSRVATMITRKRQ